MPDWFRYPPIASRVVQALDFHWNRFNDFLGCCPPAFYAVDAVGPGDSQLLDDILSEDSLFYPKDDFLKRWKTHGSRFAGNHRPFVPVSLYHVDYLFHRISIRLLIRIQVLRKPSDLLPAWDVADSITASDVERLLSALQINVETYREEKYMRYQFLREHVERFFTRSIQQYLDLVDRGGSATEDQLASHSGGRVGSVVINDLSGAILTNSAIALASGTGASSVHQRIEENLRLEALLDRIHQQCPDAEKSNLQSIVAKVRDTGVQEATKLIIRHLDACGGDWWAAARAAFLGG